MSEEIRKFLMGEAPLEGVWFGDEHPTRRGRFWWRELLRNEPPQEEKKFKPCGEGDNICSCKSEAECVYMESQDELWEEAIEKYAENSEEAKKRYRITRITSESKEPPQDEWDESLSPLDFLKIKPRQT